MFQRLCFTLAAALLLAPLPSWGQQVVITEIMSYPQFADSQREWFEVYNPGDAPVDLNGWLVRGVAAEPGFTIGASLIIEPQGYAVFGTSGDPGFNCGVSVDYVYPYANLPFSNSATDRVALYLPDGTTLVDEVQYGTGWPIEQSHSISLCDPSDDNANPAYWFASAQPFGLAQGCTAYGTPGVANESCGDRPPSITLTQPATAGETADTSFNITWVANDEESDAQIALYYDYNNTGFDGVLIVEGLSEDTDVSYLWDTSMMAPMIYYIYVVIDDGANDPLRAYAPGRVSVSHAGYETLVINEVMINPQNMLDSQGEWIELYNPNAYDVNIQDFWIGDDLHATDIYATVPILVPGQGYFVLAPSADPGGSNDYEADYVYDGGSFPPMADTVGEVVLQNRMGGPEDRVDYDIDQAWPLLSGHSISLLDPGLDNQDPANWYSSSLVTFGRGDFGTPGYLNENLGNAPPSITVLQPDGVGDTADQSFTISWRDEDPDSSALISLFYDTDASGYDGTLIVTDLAEDPDGGGDSYLWDTSDLPNGNYWVYALIDDGTNDPVMDYSSGPLTVAHALPTMPLVINEIMPQPSMVADSSGEWFEVYNPNAVDVDINGWYIRDYAADSHRIDNGGPLVIPSEGYLVLGPDADPLTNGGLTVDYVYPYADFELEDWNDEVCLYGSDGFTLSDAVAYSNQWPINSGFSMYLIATDLDNSLPTNWRTSTLHPYGDGDYGSPGGPNEVPNVVPTFSFIEPDGVADLADLSFTILWDDEDPDDDALIELWYDPNCAGTDNTLLVGGLSEDDEADLFEWDTSFLADGDYCVYAVISDGLSFLTVHADGPITVQHANPAPSLTITEPNGLDDLADEWFTITWVDEDLNDDATISLYYDTNSSGADGILIQGGISEDDEADELLWDTSLMAEGNYYIYGVITDGNVTRTVYSSGPVTVFHPNQAPSLAFVEPSGFDDVADLAFTIIWSDQDDDDDAIIDLYYDTDSSGFDGLPIAQGISEDDETDMLLWDTSGLSEGVYYIYGVINDGMNPTVMVYAPGPVQVNHGSNVPPIGDILEPDGVEDFADESFLISFVATDPDDMATIALAYDTDNQGHDGILIVDNLVEGVDESYLWDTSAVPPGAYFIYMVLDDGVNDPVVIYENHPVVVEHPSPPLIINEAMIRAATTVESFGEWVEIHNPTALDVDLTGWRISNGAAFYEFNGATIPAGGYLVVGGSTDTAQNDNASVDVAWGPLTLNNAVGSVILTDLYDAEVDRIDYIAGNWDIQLGRSLVLADPGVMDNNVAGVWCAAQDVDLFGTVSYGTPGGPNTACPINVPPNIVILQPDGVDDEADHFFTIEWVADDPDDDATIALYYDNDNLGYNGTVIQGGISEDSGQSTYLWDVGSLPDGVYWVYAVISDGENAPVYRYGSGPVTVVPPMTTLPPIVINELMTNPAQMLSSDGEWIELYNPTAQAVDIDGWILRSNTGERHVIANGGPLVIPAMGYLLMARNGNPATNGGLDVDYVYSTIALNDTADCLSLLGPDDFEPVDELCYDVNMGWDLQEGHALVLENPAMDNSLMASWFAGDAYRYSVHNTGTPGEANQARGQSQSPFFIMGDITGNEYIVINYEAYDDDSVAGIAFYYDDEGAGFDGDLAVQAMEDNGHGMAIWDATTMREGEYYIYFVISDGVNPDQMGYFPGPITVTHPSNDAPTITILDPDCVGDAVASSFTILWDDSDSNNDATVEIYHDDNNFGADGTLIVATTEDDPEDSYIWDVSALDNGMYYIYAIIDDGLVAEPVVVYATCPVEVDHSINLAPTFTFSEPDGVNDVADGSFTIEFALDDFEGNASADISYDADGDCLGGVSIGSVTQADSALVWDTTAVEPGSYTICAAVTDGVNSLTVASEHTVEVPGLGPAVTFTEPNCDADTADGSFDIRWTAENSDDPASTLTLYYDTDNDGLGGTEIVSGLAMVVGETSYSWNTSALADGVYTVYAVMEDTLGGQFTFVAQCPITVYHVPEDPTFTFVDPACAGDEKAYDSYIISWTDGGGTPAATVTLYYDTDSDGAGGTVITTSSILLSDPANTFTWDTSSLADGTSYYLYALIADGAFQATVVSRCQVRIDRGNVPPTITITAPGAMGAYADATFTIQWTATDPDNDPTISLFYDVDGMGGTPGTAITGGLIMSAGSEHIWDTSALNDGAAYYVCGTIDDGVNQAVTDCSEGMVTIQHGVNVPPTISITEPDGTGDTADRSFTILFTASDPDDDALITLKYHTFPDALGGSVIVDGIHEDTTDGTYLWDTSLLPDGVAFYVCAIINDGVNPAQNACSAGAVTIHHEPNTPPTIVLTQPDGVDDEADESFVIVWTDEDLEDDATIDLSYDTDNLCDDAIIIVEGLSEDDESDVYVWQTALIPEGDYYICAAINDGVNPTVTAVSPGTVTVAHVGVNVAPTLTFIEPDGLNDLADASFVITWSDDDPDDDAQIALYYTDGAAGVLIAGGISEDDESDAFVWNTATVEAGTYTVYATLNDGVNPEVLVYAAHPIIVEHNVTELVITEIMARPTQVMDLMGEWFEIHNPGEGAIDLDGYVIRDGGGESHTISSSLVVEPGGYVVLGNSAVMESNGGVEVDYRYTAITLDDDADSIILMAPGGATEVDRVDYDVTWPLVDGASMALIDPMLDNNIPANWRAAFTPYGDGDLGTPGAANLEDNEAPTLTILQPPRAGAEADESFIIEWTDEDTDNDAQISLYYDGDDDGEGGVLIVSGLSEDDEEDYHEWDTSAVDEGDYYIYGVIDDGVNPTVTAVSRGVVTISHGLVPLPISFAFLDPDGEDDVADQEFLIAWELTFPDGELLDVYLFYATDMDAPDDEWVMIDRLTEADDSLAWDTSELDPGDYYLRAEVEDMVGNLIRETSAFPVTVSHEVEPPDENGPPVIDISDPDEDLVTNLSVDIRFDVEDPDDAPEDVTVSIYYDDDDEGGDGFLITDELTAEDDEYEWDVSAMAPGVYYIYIEADDGTNDPVVVYAEGTITVEAGGKKGEDGCGCGMVSGSGEVPWGGGLVTLLGLALWAVAARRRRR